MMANLQVTSCNLWIAAVEQGISGRVEYRYKGRAGKFEFRGESVKATLNGREITPSIEDSGVFLLSQTKVNTEKSLKEFVPKFQRPELEVSLENLKEENVLIIYFTTVAQTSGFGLIKKDLGEDRCVLYTCTDFIHAARVFPCFNSVNIRVPYEAVFMVPKEWDILFSGHEKEKIDFEAKDLPKWVSEDLETWVDEEIGEDIDAVDLYHYKVLQQEASPYSLFFCIGNIIEVGENVWSTSEKHTEAAKVVNEIKDVALGWIKSYLDIPINSKRMKTLILPDLKNSVRDYYSLILLSNKEVKSGFETRSELVQSVSSRLCRQLFGHCVTPASLNDLCLTAGVCHYLSSVIHEANIKTLSFDSISPSLLKVHERNRCLKIDSLSIAPTVGWIEEVTGPAAEVVDSFTAQKTSLALQQLAMAMGQLEFIDFLKELVHKFKWLSCSKAQFNDLLLVRCGLMENGSRKDFITRWWDDWLESPGANTLNFDIQENGIIVNQGLTPVSGNRLRMHFLSLMFLDEKCGVIGTKTFTIKASSQCRLSHQWISESAAIIPNCDASTYARVHLDIESFKFMRENMNKLQYKMPRIMVFQSYYDYVLSMAMDPIHFCKIVIKHYDQKLSKAYQDKIISEYFWPAMNLYLKPDQFKAVAHTFFLLCFDLLSKSQLYGCLPSFMIRCCTNKADVLKLIDLVDAMPASAPGKREFASLMVMKAEATPQIDDGSKQRVYDRYVEIYEKSSPELVVSLDNMLNFHELSPAKKREGLYEKLTSKKDSSYVDCLEALRTVPEYLEEGDLQEYLDYVNEKFLDHLPLLSKYLGELLIPGCNNSLLKVISTLEGLKNTEKYEILTRKWRVAFELLLADLKLRSKWMKIEDAVQNK